jgi:putative hydrolase of the HAD superfamily
LATTAAEVELPRPVDRLVQAEPGLKHRISALRRRVLFHALEEVGYSEKQAQELANEGFEVFLHARHQVEVFPEVQPVLEILRHHYTLGVVTNGNADVRRLGLADYFRFALCAEDLGIGMSTLTRWLSQERDVDEPS